MEVRWGDRGGFQSQQWLMGIFLPRTVNAHLCYIKAWQMYSRGQRGEIKHGSLCLRVSWQTVNGVTGWNRPWAVLQGSLCLLGTGASLADTDSWWHTEETHQGWRGHCSHAPSIKTDQTGCNKWKPCECEVSFEGIKAIATVRQTPSNPYILNLKVTMQTG